MSTIRMVEAGKVCTRTYAVKLRRNISYIEKKAAALYGRAPSRCYETKQYGDKVNPLQEVMSERKFMARFRFPKPVVARIADEFGHSDWWEKDNDPEDPCCKKYVNAEWVTCMGLRYLASGASLQLLCDTQGRCCKATISTNINRFIGYCACMSATNIKFPRTPEEFYELEQKVAERYGISGCVAFVDGTYVPMMQPAVNEHLFYCRKHYHALNVQIICDADQRIIALDAGFGGANQDSTVFERSDIGQEINGGLLGDYYLIGDNGYALTESMITPFRQTQLRLPENKTQAVEKFQEKVTGARSCVEQCNAQLKGRWRVLSKYGSGVIMREPHEVALIVHACGYLHNLAIDEGLAPITRETQKDPDMEQLIKQNALVFLLNCAKRNKDRVFRANHRPQSHTDYLRGVLKRNQILREQFGDRSQRLGRLPGRRRGRPLGSTNANRRGGVRQQRRE